jgi:RNA polymerase sigma-70 factor (ECF subfamily)
MSDDNTSDNDMDELWRLHRPYLVDLAFRMLGNIQDAEDAVQEAFTRLLGVNVGEIDEIRGWLIVVVSRLCLDQLRSAKTRREATVGSVDDLSPPPLLTGVDPVDRVTLDDSLRMAMLVVLEQLSPPERAVFVLDDVFRFPFDEVRHRRAYSRREPSDRQPGTAAHPGGDRTGPVSDTAGIVVFKVRDARIYDIHAIADPRKLTFVSDQLASRC